jgi:hypothetical protein
MKPHSLIAASALALAAAACGPQVPAARAALECPATQGDLTRTSAAADGKTCTYTNDAGAEVTLQLVSVAGDVDTTLAAIEKTLLAGRAAGADADGKAAEAQATDPKAAAGATASARAAEQATRQAMEDTRSAGAEISVKADSNGLAVTTDDGGTTRVELPGVHIVANDAEDTAKVKIGPLSIDAADDGAKVRMRRDTRLRGEPLRREKRGFRALFIYAGDDLPNGYRFVGYEAGGPKRGPITVATVRSKTDGPDGDDIYPDVKKLVRKNGGV